MSEAPASKKHAPRTPAEYHAFINDAWIRIAHEMTTAERAAAKKEKRRPRPISAADVTAERARMFTAGRVRVLTADELAAWTRELASDKHETEAKK